MYGFQRTSNFVANAAAPTMHQPTHDGFHQLPNTMKKIELPNENASNSVFAAVFEHKTK